MERLFNSAREVFRHYFPKSFDREECEKISGPYQISEQIPEDKRLVEKLLKDFKNGLN